MVFLSESKHQVIGKIGEIAFIDAADEAEYNNAVAQFKKKSLYDTGVTPQYGQQLITLVTCTYQVDNGRFVVVACEKEQHR